jgi:phosphoglycolate phosphatase-like HAD superfamily hydrolase
MTTASRTESLPDEAPGASPSPAPLLVFDFDGVLVDGMAEYWWAARRAALRLVPDLQLPGRAPAAFSLLRPHIHQGWEMVLVAAELGRAAASGERIDPSGYQAALFPALRRWGWSPEDLQQALEAVRSEALSQDRQAWLDLHRFYPGVVERLGRLAEEGAAWGVLTTKGGAYAAEILAAAGLQPRFLHGHEQGSKPEVLLRLSAQGRPLWFVEDRRPTLETVRATAGLEQVRCFLVSWGYLTPEDPQAVAGGPIRWLTAESFAAPLAEWP